MREYPLPRTYERMGTNKANRQWGNTMVLHAVYKNPLFEGCITPEELIAITTNVKIFLQSVSQPGGAIEMDLKFLDAVAKETGIFEVVMRRVNESPASSFNNGPWGGRTLSLKRE